jgi:uncharacterized membrane protein HdeD (DUF308 family)
VKNPPGYTLDLWRNKTRKIMTSTQSNAAIDGQTVETAKALRKLYFTRTGFSVLWVILVVLFAKTSVEFGAILLIIYPAWDVAGTLLDIRANQGSASKMPQYVNVVISSVTTVAVAIALQKGVPEALIVFGAWAIGTGLIQLILGLRRNKFLGGQWPMIISGSQSVIGGTFTIILAHNPSKGIPGLSTYVAFGAFYYLLAAIRLSKTVKKVSAA